MYYPGEEKLVSLDVLKLYCGEDVVRQEHDDVDPYRWIDEGELTELPQVERGYTWRQDLIQIVQR